MNLRPRLSSALERLFDARAALLALLAYATLHVALRVAISPALRWDEAEQVLWSQHLLLGYGAQPPLYTWLQRAVNALLGTGVLALSLLKHTLLALCFVLMYLAARELSDARETRGARNAWLAAAALMLMPPLTWYSVRDQTHTVLVTALVLAAWWLLLRGVRRPRPLLFAAQGVVWGLALLAKYNAALALAAMLAAALSLPALRRALFSRGWPLAPLAALIITVPHLAWVAWHWHAASHQTLQRMTVGAHGIAHGLLELGNGVLAVLGLWALALMFAFGRALWRRAPNIAEGEATTPPAWALPLVLRALLLTALVLVCMSLAGVSTFKGRWLLPLLAPAPLALLAAHPHLASDGRGMQRFALCVLMMALLLALMGGTRARLSALRGRMDTLNHPTRQLAAELRAAGYDGSAPIIGADPVLAAELRLHFSVPAAACWVPDDAPDSSEAAACVAAHTAEARRAGRGLLLVSRGARCPADWWPLALAAAGTSQRVPRSVHLPLRHARAGKPVEHFQFFWQPPSPAHETP